MDTPRLDPERLRRAVKQLECEPLADGRWCVTGGSAPHIVDADATECDCPDFLYRRAACAHVCRVRLAMGDAATVRALRELLPERSPRKRRRAVASSAGVGPVSGLTA